MIKHLFLVGSAALTFSHDLASAQDVPLYVDAQGEEVFGSDYLPRDPVNLGEPLQVGTPSAGFPVHAETMPQNSVGISLPMSEARDAPELVPVRRTIRKARGLPKFKFKAAASPQFLPSGSSAADAPTAASLSEMTVHFVYVGQGAGAILEFPCGVAVIDSGGEYGPGAAKGGKLFVDYLSVFFAARPQLNRTIDVLFTSHPHKDHLAGLSLILPQDGPAFTVRNIVDNGQSGSSGSLASQTVARNAAVAAGAGYSAVRLQDQISATGSTNKVIDPFKCPAIDPIITAFWGSRNEAVTGNATSLVHKYANPNNHSVVVRVDFGKASFLFTGDLEEQAISDMLKEYGDNPGVFDVGVYHVGHHAADNGTTDPLLRATTPKIAVISMGDNSQKLPTTAWDHGHPRKSTLRRMQVRPDIVSDMRTAITFWGATAEETPFVPVKITKAIYGTGWEGTIKLRARSDGTYQIVP
jgi:beta-lactamase superfamily II metal-dependent hydrolase